MKQIYLDYNATTPIDPEVAEVMKPFLSEYFGNPSSIHEYGITTSKAVIKARSQVAALINCKPDEIIFTSGGTESNNYAIKGIAYANRTKGNHIITSQIEHPAVIEVCRFLEEEGFDVTYLSVDQYGMVDPEAVRKRITSQTILISIMHANNEVGTIQPIAEISSIARKFEIPFHTDCAQSIGKIEVDVEKMGVSLLSVAGHKLYAPKGVGALYVKTGLELRKLIHGADHEMNMRAGTENVLEIVGLGHACEMAKRDLDENSNHLLQMKIKLFDGLKAVGLDIRLNGHPEKCLPNTLSIGFGGIEANTLLLELQKVAASAGAACHTESEDTSSVLKSMGVPDHYSMGTLRFSTGKYNTAAEIEEAINYIVSAVKSISPDNAQAVQKDQKEKIRLTQYTHGLGCACKIRPQYLERVLKDFPIIENENVLISLNTSDDAAVYKISNETAIIESVDFFTPVVDDPYHFGAIAAANALSDIYAMGGKPIFALNIVGFPDNRLPESVLKQILKGANDKAKEADISILGGHTIEDNEPKFGMTVTGIVHPEKIITNSNMQIGDVLILTKPLGTGIIATGVKRGVVAEELEEEAILIMSTLNRSAAKVMSRFPVNACTDVTGFGFLGHLKEMAIASGKTISIDANKIPVISGVKELVAQNIIPGGTLNNIDFVKDVVEWGTAVSKVMKTILCDAQTSGGLLISLPAEFKEQILSELIKENKANAWCVGEVVGNSSGKVKVG
jgi:cysteine desulfurase NifS/selenium donor protein